VLGALAASVVSAAVFVVAERRPEVCSRVHW
jgi:hypothetical protein